MYEKNVLCGLKRDIKINCTECRACVKVCPMLLTYVKSPKMFFSEVKLDEKAVFACRNCNLCTEVCGFDLPIGETFKITKEYIGMSNRKILSKKYKKVSLHQKLYFSKIASFSANRNEQRDCVSEKVYTFFPGCTLSGYSAKIVVSLVKLLDEKLGKVNVLQKCCAIPTKFSGELGKYKKLQNDLIDELTDLGTTHVVTACSMCKSSFERFGNINVISLWDVLADTKIDRKEILPNEIYSIHDSCASRYDFETHNAIRKITRNLGLKIEEGKFIRQKTKCCGYGGMVNIGDEKMFERMREDTCSSFNTNDIITYCVSCKKALQSQGKSVHYILDLLFDDTLTNSKFSSIRNLMNIRKIKKGYR